MNEGANGDASLVYVAVPDAQTGRQIGRVVVERRLAACANLVPRIESIYWWDGQVTEDAEALLFLKTRSELVDKLMTVVRELHPYEVPAVSALPLASVDRPYLEWLFAETEA